ncbi:RNA binding repeat protein, Pumilio-family [Dictyocaulus viviparus]|uniref:RNA binding repeat protein, Pumilio-family n=1 Tax=Dictyocaulus viviparus TaxID=29172 RepID=A0A0D8YA27_DICVI|nr:RNA binding repeat protein, Pumilio-family [Dictyocaulus viviparus]
MSVSRLQNTSPREDGFGCRTTFVSPICYPHAPHLSDSGISVSNTKFNTSTEEILYSPPGFPKKICSPEDTAVRKPLSHLDSNAPPFTPLYRQRYFETKSSVASLVVSPLSQLRLEESYDIDNSFAENRSRSLLPSWVMDGQGHIIAPLRKVLDEGLLETFARDKNGCTFLQQNYPADGSSDRELIVKELFERNDLFESLCTDVFGNFFVQCAVQNATLQEQRWVTSHLLGRKLYPMCLNRYSCRVIQKVIECLPEELKSLLMLELHNSNLVTLCTDQNANHVIQKIMTSFTLSHWQFMIEHFIRNREELFSVAENKYGCRVIQLAIEILSDTGKKFNKNRGPMLEKVMDHVVSNCERLASNEFANYVIQHVIKAGPLSDYRDKLIEQCLLRNLLSLSQEKYASHVVEKALEFAPPSLLAEMMDEIFDGYVPHPETKKDALDIMLFHQYGNYVVQRMLDICCEAARAKRNGINLPDIEQRMEWLRRLESRIAQNRHRLARYSSGKKILTTLQQLDDCANPTTPSRCRRSCVQTSVPSKYR